MPATDHIWAYQAEVPDFRLGRIATKHVRTLFDRFWLKAEVRRRPFNVGSWMKSGRWDVRFGPEIGLRGSMNPTSRRS